MNEHTNETFSHRIPYNFLDEEKNILCTYNGTNRSYTECREKIEEGITKGKITRVRGRISYVHTLNHLHRKIKEDKKEPVDTSDIEARALNRSLDIIIDILSREAA